MKQQFLIPGVILLGGVFIALGIVFNGGNAADLNIAYAAEREQYQYIYGNPQAETTIVEFSDFECPFCARLHPILKRIVDESEDSIKWEYRHLPLPSHRNAEAAAYAGECVGRLGGNNAFWEFADRALTNQRSLGNPFYESEVLRLGIDINEFTACMNDKEIYEAVAADREAALSFGGRGTPFSVIVFSDGTVKPISGALPYEQWLTILNR